MTSDQLSKFESLGGGCTCPTQMCHGDCLGHLSGVASSLIKSLKLEVSMLQAATEHSECCDCGRCDWCLGIGCAVCKQRLGTERK